jgi:hypothetical protein
MKAKISGWYSVYSIKFSTGADVVVVVVVPLPEGALVVVPPPAGALVVVPPLSKRKARSVCLGSVKQSINDTSINKRQHDHKVRYLFLVHYNSTTFSTNLIRLAFTRLIYNQGSYTVVSHDPVNGNLFSRRVSFMTCVPLFLFLWAP